MTAATSTNCKLSVVVPCYNEESTLRECIEGLLKIASPTLALEVIIVNDSSRDRSEAIAKSIAEQRSEVTVLSHAVNQGKGAALRTGFAYATGDYVAVHDADMEYDPNDLVRLLCPLINGSADVVFGSRFLTTHEHRVLHFWHSKGNALLTLLSNMFTDMNLSDMETCYKVFKREIIQSIKIEENRFGFEPEVVAKIADLRCRVYEMGISYRGRTYEEGKKIGIKDGFRALYCIVRYNAHRAPIYIQFGLYLIIGGVAAVLNLLIYLVLYRTGVPAVASSLTAFLIAAVANYLMCVSLLFRKGAKWGAAGELTSYTGVVLVGAAIDTSINLLLLSFGCVDWLSKSIATLSALMFNFLGRRFVVFSEKSRGPWRATRSEDAKDNKLD